MEPDENHGATGHEGAFLPTSVPPWCCGPWRAGSRNTTSIFLGKALARPDDRHGIEIGRIGIRQQLRGPVLSHGPLTQLVQLVQTKRSQALSRTGIEVPLPGNGHTVSHRWNFKHKNTIFRHRQLVDFTESDAWLCAFDHLHF